MQDKILICGILPPPYFGHSMTYKMLIESDFMNAYNVKFLNLHFWTYKKHKKVTIEKLWKLFIYLGQYIYLIITFRPRYILCNMSFDKMPFLKDFLFFTIGRIFGRKMIIHDHGQYVKELYQSCGKIYQSLIRWMLNNTHACILFGEKTKLEYDGFIEKNRLFSVPGGVEDSTSIVTKDLTKDSDRDTNVLYFSYMSKTKGVLTAFEAASNVLNHNSTVHFTFAGPMESDDIKMSYDQLSNKYNSRIKYLGYVGDDTERTNIYRNTDIFIFPTHRDVFGLVLLHAMAEGIALIASIEGTIPEIIEDGHSGLLFPKGDSRQLSEKIITLAKDAQLRKHLGKNARERYLKMYTPQAFGQRMIETFHEIQKI